jgi:hypothetical protein
VRLLWLPDHLRSWGLVVVEQPHWREMGRDFAEIPNTVVGHHTATSLRTHGDMPTLRILREGRPDLPGPLCQVAVSRSGVVHVIASGKANHAGRGAWKGCTTSGRTVGIEVEHPGTGGWKTSQLDAFDLTVAAVLDGLSLTADRYCGHREWALPPGRKVDPGGVDLHKQRERVMWLLHRHRHKSASSILERNDMELYKDGNDLVAWSMLGRRRIENAAELNYWRASGRLGALKVTDLAEDPVLADVVSRLPWTEAAR